MKQKTESRVVTRTTCRSCGLGGLVSILSLGNQYVSAFVDSPDDQTIRVPLELVFCDPQAGGCGLLQLKHTTPPELMYTQYWYKSGINSTMRDALADITRRAEEMVDLKAGDMVLDIGCNDGTLLRSYRTEKVRTVGFEPAANLVPEARVGTTRIIHDFFNYPALQKNLGDVKAKVITSIAMFYDLEDPNRFVGDITRGLAPDGIWVIQMSYLPMMLETNAFDNICHEHLEYYSLASLEHLLKRHSLEVFHMELNDVNGGSFRVYVKHAQETSLPGPSAEVREFRRRERDLGLHDRRVYDRFTSRVNSIKSKTRDFIERETARGKTVYVYGASTKGNTLLQFFGLDHTRIKAAAERNPDKWGKKTVGTLIPIVSEQEARVAKPDYFLVLPWHFLREFREREKAYLGSGGRFIVPLPQFEVIRG